MTNNKVKKGSSKRRSSVSKKGNKKRTSSKRSVNKRRNKKRSSSKRGNKKRSVNKRRNKKRSSSKKQIGGNLWICEICAFENPEYVIACKKCTHPNPGRWQVELDIGWTNYETTVSNKISTAKIKNKPSVEVVVNSKNYVINFAQGKQYPKDNQHLKRAVRYSKDGGGGGGGAGGGSGGGGVIAAAAATGSTCLGCGFLVKSGDSFCTKCGKAVDAGGGRAGGGGGVGASVSAEGSYEPPIDALKPSFRHMDDRDRLLINYSDMVKLLNTDLLELLKRARTHYPHYWKHMILSKDNPKFKYFEYLLKEIRDDEQEMTIKRHRFNKDEYMDLQTQTFKIIPTTLPDKPTTGYFDLSFGVKSGEAISDFANRYLGGDYLGIGLVQEELMFHKTPILFLTQLDQYIKGTPITLPGYDSLVIKGATQLWDINMYKIFARDWDSKTKLRSEPIGPSKIVVFDALNLKRIEIDGNPITNTNYLKREVIWHIIKYYNTFDGAVKSGITKLHSGSIGAGAFGHSHAASFLMQMFALCLVNIKYEMPILTLILHTDPDGHPTKAEQELAYETSMIILSSLDKRRIEDALTEIIRIITTNEIGLYTVIR